MVSIEIPGSELFMRIVNIILEFLPYIIILLVLLIIYKILTKKRNYSKKTVEIKEAPLEINNLMRDPVKRNIIRALRKQKKYMTAISREINENAPLLRYHLKQLEKAHLLMSYKLAREAYFSLTDQGQWCLEAINFYYPITNLQLIFSRLKRFIGISKMEKLITPKGKILMES
jgi:DNA-binding transcriptional ArsR family regulator